MAAARHCRAVNARAQIEPEANGTARHRPVVQTSGGARVPLEHPLPGARVERRSTSARPYGPPDCAAASVPPLGPPLAAEVDERTKSPSHGAALARDWSEHLLHDYQRAAFGRAARKVVGR